MPSEASSNRWSAKLVQFKKENLVHFKEEKLAQLKEGITAVCRPASKERRKNTDSAISTS